MAINITAPELRELKPRIVVLGLEELEEMQLII